MRTHPRLVSRTGNTFNEHVDSGIKQSKTVDVWCRPLRVDLLQAAVATVGGLRQQCYVTVASTTVVATISIVRLASWRVLRFLPISSGVDTERRGTRPTATWWLHRRRRRRRRRRISSSTAHNARIRLQDCIKFKFKFKIICSQTPEKSRKFSVSY